MALHLPMGKPPSTLGSCTSRSVDRSGHFLHGDVDRMDNGGHASPCD